MTKSRFYVNLFSVAISSKTFPDGRVRPGQRETEAKNKEVDAEVEPKKENKPPKEVQELEAIIDKPILDTRR